MGGKAHASLEIIATLGELGKGVIYTPGLDTCNKRLDFLHIRRCYNIHWGSARRSKRGEKKRYGLYDSKHRELGQAAALG